MEATASNPETWPVENEVCGLPPAEPAEVFDSAPEREPGGPDSDAPGDDGAYAGAENADLDPEPGEPEVPIPSCIQFRKKGPNDTQLSATVKPGGEFSVGIPIESIRSWIRQQGCESWLIDENSLSRLAREARRLKESREYVLAERKDCRIEVKVSGDRLYAWVAVSQAFGGEPFSEARLREALDANNIRFGIREDTLQEILDHGWCEKRLIAEGAPPVEGDKTRFEPLVKESDHKGVPQEREDGRVDYKDLGLYLSVTKGTPLLRRIPPTPGTPGTGVDGEAVLPPHPRDRTIHPGAGTAISPDDPDVVFATRAGEPHFEDNTVRVDTTLEVDKVDPSTGNVIFDGNVVVRGTVESGYSVQAGNDLTILDTVEGGNLTAGRNLTLVTGVYGKRKSKIRVGGNLEARFLSDCTIQCGGKIEITDLMSHCTVDCDGDLQLGQLGGKGQIIGGDIRTLQAVRARIIGSVSEIHTRIAVGHSKEILKRLEKVKEETALVESELQMTSKNLQLLWEDETARESYRFKELTKKESVLSGKLGALKEEAELLQKKLDSSRKGRILADHVYRGAFLSAGSEHETVSDLTSDFCLNQPSEAKSPN